MAPFDEGEECYGSRDALLLLHAGFLVHHRGARLTSELEKKDSITNTSEVAWPFLDLFVAFISYAIRLEAAVHPPKAISMPPLLLQLLSPKNRR